MNRNFDNSIANFIANRCNIFQHFGNNLDKSKMLHRSDQLSRQVHLRTKMTFSLC